eukprot:scaffold15245_cov48-Phaeocystis_antarctica.AAC.2
MRVRCPGEAPRPRPVRPLPRLCPSREDKSKRRELTAGAWPSPPLGQASKRCRRARPPLVITPLGEADEALEDGRGELKTDGLLDADARRLPPAARLVR